MSDTDLLIVLTVVLAALVVLVLAVALIEVRRGLTRISAGLATLASALQGVEAEHLRPLEGAVTGTIPAAGTLTLSFEIVRHTAKQEAPLVQLIGSPRIISTIAEVTFFGQDRVGNDVSVSGSILIDFGNFGD